MNRNIEAIIHLKALLYDAEKEMNYELCCDLRDHIIILENEG